jgi:hypothetical protein
MNLGTLSAGTAAGLNFDLEGGMTGIAAILIYRLPKVFSDPPSP